MDMETMHQEAPYPRELFDLVSALRYKPGWLFMLGELDRGQGSRGLTLTIHVTGLNSYHPEERIGVNHYMLVPPAAYDIRSWRRWLFDQILLVERHEAMEWFRLEPGVRPFAPSHGPGNDPYLIREVGTDEDRRTSFRGELNP
jgi:hypothetical protein